MHLKLLKAVLIFSLLFLTQINGYSPLKVTHVFSSHIFPPKENPKLSNVKAQEVNVYSSYSSEPAPMGIADYGVCPNGAYIVHKTQVLAKACINNLCVQTSSYTNCISAQLNVVLTYNYQGHQYSIWLQDVALIMLFNDTIKFIDNVWNMTSPKAGVGGIQGNGVICSSGGVTFYYYCANGYPGSPTTFSYPLHFCVLIKVGVNSLDEPVAYFCYNDGYGWVRYDKVTFLFPGSNNVSITINGCQYTGSGNFYDIEFVIGGPGGGSSATFNSGCVYLYLYYWNGQSFQEVKNAYNFGSDTAETSCNVIDCAYSQNGQYAAKLTPGSGSLGMLWSSNQVSASNIEIMHYYSTLTISEWSYKA
ncbi:thermopsin [Acidianus ambivalens]|uniref:Thermopsin n=1 Tax=Acidianus ambivalens TaxID=2283 RepID=A0A650CTW0_ACIAM|nr:thermopsin [Acidianus ambivalens]MQL56180.1 hypothetical protein [Acidianus ambivalens]QGR21280.1 hypothetical protein D1866_04175 [Acidianus ambivalens]